jgi:hypothetical protein
MESNTKVRAEMEYMGGEVYKRYRVFGKSLARLTKKEAEEKKEQRTRMKEMLLTPCE